MATFLLTNGLVPAFVGRAVSTTNILTGSLGLRKLTSCSKILSYVRFSMPQPKAFDPDEALQKAMQVFWERGYEAMSVDDLVQLIGINRFSLYSTLGASISRLWQRSNTTVTPSWLTSWEYWSNRQPDSLPSDNSSRVWSIFLRRLKGGAVT